MRLLFIVLLMLSGSCLFAQKEKRDIHAGNQLYLQKKYAEAEENYRRSISKSQQSVPGNFNLGDALYKQKKFDNAAQKFTDIANAATDKSVKAKAYHNLGNSLLESKKLEESIAAYKKSLMNNPKDDETRYNLAYAQQKLKQQEEQKKKDDKNKDDKNNKDKEKDKQDPKKDNQDKNKEKQNPEKVNQKGEQPKPDQLSKEDAERLLDALNQEEKNTQDKLKNKKAKGVKGKIVKDW